MPWHLVLPFQAVEDRSRALHAVELLNTAPEVASLDRREVDGMLHLEVGFADEANPTTNTRLLDLYYQFQRSRPNANGDTFPTPHPHTRIIAEYLASTEGRQRLAQAMIEPLTRRRMAGFDLIPIQQMPEGARPIYDRDPEVFGTFTMPEWAKVETWIYNKQADAYAYILRVEDSWVEVHRWRQPDVTSTIGCLSLNEEWCPSDAPLEPRTVWQRLLDEGPDQ